MNPSPKSSTTSSDGVAVGTARAPCPSPGRTGNLSAAAVKRRQRGSHALQMNPSSSPPKPNVILPKLTSVATISTVGMNAAEKPIWRPPLRQCADQMGNSSGFPQCRALIFLAIRCVVVSTMVPTVKRRLLRRTRKRPASSFTWVGRGIGSTKMRTKMYHASYVDILLRDRPRTYATIASNI